MVFKTAHSATGNVARSHIRSSVTMAYSREPISKDVCLMCRIISRIQQNAKQYQKDLVSSADVEDESNIMGLKTPCIDKNDDSIKVLCEAVDGSAGETKPEVRIEVSLENGSDTQKSVDQKLNVTLDKDMTEILNASCMTAGKRDKLRQTIFLALNHACQHWIVTEVESANVKAILNRAKNTKDDIEQFIYQLSIFVAVPGRSLAVTMRLCNAHLKVLVNQSYAFLMDHTANLFTAHTSSEFNGDLKWVEKTFNNFLVNKNQSGRAAKVNLNNKRKNEITEEVNGAEDEEPTKKKKKKKKVKKLEIRTDENKKESFDEVAEESEAPTKNPKRKGFKKKKGKKGKIVSVDESNIDS